MSKVFWQAGVTLDQVEKMVITEAMVYFGGNKTQTARALDISVRGLDHKLARYNGNQSVDTTGSEESGDDKETCDSTEAGDGLESSAGPTEEHAVPVSKPEEVQEVLPTKHSTGRGKKVS